MLSGRKLDCTVLIGAVALTRFWFRSRYLYDVDSVNFALAIGRFDPSVHQPHPPGYFLYICVARLISVFFPDPNAVLVAISIAASCGAAALVYLFADEWFGAQAARFAGLLFLFSPLVWFHGTVALTYIVEAFFSALMGYICWRVYSGSRQWLLPGAVTLAFAAGVRPSSLLFLGPLYLFSLLSVPLKNALIGLGTLTVALLAWFLPMIYASGGPTAYFASLSLLWQLSPGRQNALQSLALVSAVRFSVMVGILGMCFGSASVLFGRALYAKPVSERRRRIFTVVWITPALLFFTFVFLRFVNSGYLLVVFPGVCVWAAHWASEWYSRSRFQTAFKMGLIALAATLNVAIFLQAPVYCSYGEVRRFEAELDNVRKALPQVASPQRTLIVAFDSHFSGFRHAGYYFPNYMVAEFPETQFPAGRRVFTMQHRDTRVMRQLSTGGFANFVLFPLPRAGDEYRRYVSETRSRFPDEHLQTITVRGCEFITGPIADLSLLFPATSDRSVYTARD